MSDSIGTGTIVLYVTKGVAYVYMVNVYSITIISIITIHGGWGHVCQTKQVHGQAGKV